MCKNIDDDELTTLSFFSFRLEQIIIIKNHCEVKKNNKKERKARKRKRKNKEKGEKEKARKKKK